MWISPGLPVRPISYSAVWPHLLQKLCISGYHIPSPRLRVVMCWVMSSHSAGSHMKALLHLYNPYNPVTMFITLITQWPWSPCRRPCRRLLHIQRVYMILNNEWQWVMQEIRKRCEVKMIRVNWKQNNTQIEGVREIYRHKLHRMNWWLPVYIWPTI